MNSLDFLYISLSFAALSIAVFINLVLYQVVQTLITARKTVEDLSSVTHDVVAAKNNAKMATLKMIQKILAFIPRKTV